MWRAGSSMLQWWTARIRTHSFLSSNLSSAISDVCGLNVTVQLTPNFGLLFEKQCNLTCTKTQAPLVFPSRINLAPIKFPWITLQLRVVREMACQNRKKVFAALSIEISLDLGERHKCSTEMRWFLGLDLWDEWLSLLVSWRNTHLWNPDSPCKKFTLCERWSGRNVTCDFLVFCEFFMEYLKGICNHSHFARPPHCCQRSSIPAPAWVLEQYTFLDGSSVFVAQVL